MNVYSDKIVQLQLRDILAVVPMTEENAIDWAMIDDMDKDVKAYEAVKTFAGWNGSVPTFKPLIPTGYSEIRKEYATNIARELGAQIAGVQFAPDCVNDISRIPSFLMKVVMAAGVMVGDKVMHLRYMTQNAKSNDAVLPLVDVEWGKAMDEFFPDPADTVRPGALHSPLRGGFHRVKVNVLVVEDNDRTYRMVGDGQGIVDRRKMNARGVEFTDSPQFRAVIGMDKPWSQRALGKGTLYMASLPAGIDMVLPKSTIKSNKGVKIELGRHVMDMAFGIMNGPGERLAGPIYIGEQVWQWADRETVDAAGPLVSSKLSELRSRVNDTSWLAERGFTLYDEDGNLQQFEVIKLFADVCVKLGNNKLMRSRMIVDALTDWVATVGYQTIAGLGTYAWRFRAVCRRTLTDGCVAINPRVFRMLFGEGVEGNVATLAIRYPFAEDEEAVAIEVMADPKVRWYEAHVNDVTLNRAALDFDGDAFAILRPDKHVLLTRGKVQNLPWLETKVRQSAEAPKRKSVMIVQSMSAGIGLIDHAISRCVAVWHLRSEYRRQAIVNIKALRIELQKAVDSVKKAATADMSVVNALSQWAGKLVNREDYAFRKLRKNTALKPFTTFEGTLDQAEAVSFTIDPDRPGLVQPGKPIMPSIFLGKRKPEDMVPLAGFIVEHEDEVPLISQMWLPNATFARWLPVISGEGRTWALDMVEKLNQRLNAIAKEEREGTINGDKAKALRSELFANYKAVWAAKRTEMAGNREWLESAASGIWTAWTKGNNRGFALKFSIPEVIAEMLIARKDEISTGEAQIGRILGGEEFRAKYMTHDDQYMVVDVVEKDGGLAVVAHGGVPHAVKDVVVPVGKHRVKVATTGGKSLSVMFTGDAVDDSFDLPASVDAGPVMPDDAPDYAFMMDEVIEVDVDVM